MEVENNKKFMKNIMFLSFGKIMNVSWWQLFSKKKFEFFVNEWNRGKHVFACYESTINYFKLKQ